MKKTYLPYPPGTWFMKELVRAWRMVHEEDLSPLPSWNLADPEVLEGSMAEPQDNWDWRSLIKKTFFLVALATPKRI